MADKVFIKTPPPMRTMFIAQIVLGILFLPFGLMFVFIAEGEAKPFVVMFALIWVVGCVSIILHSVKALQLINKGDFQIAEIKNENTEKKDNFSVRLREIEDLKKDNLISENEYQLKRDEILKEKW
ncbi:MAG: hypothetical protein HQL29_04720 [Candidatus Omnitrophica bacterium]|nr:hypothetical protein [Candidatus Omnitrophota bacterium]